MSGEHAKTVGTRAEDDMKWGAPEKITAFFCVNLLAAYAPAVAAVVWLTGLLSWRDGPATVLAIFLISPVGVAGCLLSTVMDPTSLAAGFVCLAAFILLLIWASVALHNSRKAWVAMPSIVLVYSLLQGVLFARILEGINALP